MVSKSSDSVTPHFNTILLMTSNNLCREEFIVTEKVDCMCMSFPHKASGSVFPQSFLRLLMIHRKFVCQLDSPHFCMTADARLYRVLEVLQLAKQMTQVQMQLQPVFFAHTPLS